MDTNKVSKYNKTYLASRQLVIGRRDGGNIDMFVATIIEMKSKSFNSSNNVQNNFNFLGGNNFNGIVFCSTLDGHFVEAYEYINGNKMFLPIITKNKLLQCGSSLKCDKYTSLKLNNGLMSRSGSYWNNESGGGGGGNPEDLGEVIIRVCQKCGQRLEPGEIHDCRCVWCHSYPCKCCPICQLYPCKCQSNICSICRQDPCIKCSYCGHHFCYGECRNVGGGSGGGSGGSSGGSNTGNVTGHRVTPQKLKDKAKEVAASITGTNAMCNIGVIKLFYELFGETLTGRANDICLYLKDNPDKWEEVYFDDLIDLSELGYFVIASFYNNSGSGHVSVIVPGTIHSGRWCGKICNRTMPNSMDTGAGHRSAKWKLSDGFGVDKQPNVKFYKYK